MTPCILLSYRGLPAILLLPTASASHLLSQSRRDGFPSRSGIGYSLSSASERKYQSREHCIGAWSAPCLSEASAGRWRPISERRRSVRLDRSIGVTRGVMAHGYLSFPPLQIWMFTYTDAER
uniref:Secreted protein n=1 Tax=Oryza sativa subsp. japonica TaxID=39947 RepID=Q67UU3_ORYSJ|nr:hypothetical protein [Oryza sativa Japonica Group]